jgi:hypothetical protein
MYEVDFARIEEYAYRFTFEGKFRRFQAPSYCVRHSLMITRIRLVIHIENMLGMMKHCVMSFYFVLMGQFCCLR